MQIQIIAIPHLAPSHQAQTFFALRPGKWISGRGWSEIFQGQRKPTSASCWSSCIRLTAFHVEGILWLSEQTESKECGPSGKVDVLLSPDHHKQHRMTADSYSVFGVPFFFRTADLGIFQFIWFVELVLEVVIPILGHCWLFGNDWTLGSGLHWRLMRGGRHESKTAWSYASRKVWTSEELPSLDLGNSPLYNLDLCSLSLDRPLYSIQSCKTKWLRGAKNQSQMWVQVWWECFISFYYVLLLCKLNVLFLPIRWVSLSLSKLQALHWTLLQGTSAPLLAEGRCEHLLH